MKSGYGKRLTVALYHGFVQGRSASKPVDDVGDDAPDLKLLAVRRRPEALHADFAAPDGRYDLPRRGPLGAIDHQKIARADADVALGVRTGAHEKGGRR